MPGDYSTSTHRYLTTVAFLRQDIQKPSVSLSDQLALELDLQGNLTLSPNGRHRSLRYYYSKRGQGPQPQGLDHIAFT